MDEENKNSFNIKIVGLPQNDDLEIEVPDEEPEKKDWDKRSMLNDLNGGKLPKELEDALKESLGGLFKSMGASDEDINDAFKMSLQIRGLKSSYDDDESEAGSEEKEEKFVYELGKIAHLFQKDAFKQILYYDDPNLYVSFVEKFGQGPYPTSLFSSLNWPIFSSCPIPLTKIKEFQVIDYNNKYILLYGTSADTHEQGVFIAITRTPDGEDYQIVVPEYGNTYDLINTSGEYNDNEMFSEDPNNCRLYSSETDPVFNKDGKFVFLDLNKVYAGLNLLLCENNTPLVSPKDFGEVVQMRSTVNTAEYSKGLRVGIIKSNDSTKSQLLKRDFDVPEDKNTFDFYLRFTDTVDGEILNFLADYFSKVDLPNSKLMETSELKVAGRGDILYIDFDLGTIAEDLPRWIQNRGNSEF